MKVEPAGQPEATAANASAIDAAPHVVPAEQLADALSCPICLGLLKDPLIAACCHNNFCRQCLKSSLLSKPECPLCRAPLVLENTLPNRAIRNLLPPEAQETADEGPTTFKQTTLLAGGKVPPACVLLLFMLSFASISFAPPRMPCFSTSFRTGGLWECHHASGTEAEPSLRGGRPLEPPVPWVPRAAEATSSPEAPRLMRFGSPPVLEAAAGAGDSDDEPTSSSGRAPGGREAWLGDE